MNTMTVSDLDERIAAAFQTGVSSGTVAKLIKEAEAAAVASDEAAQRARVRALDPALHSPDVTAARREMEDAAFRRDRLQTAAQKLGDRFRELQKQEENERRQIAYDRIKAERNALAEELRQLYPGFAEQLGKLLARIEANDREVEFVNRNLPRGGGRLLVAELIARGLEGFMINRSPVPSIVSEVRLPAFEYSLHHAYIWTRK